METNSQHTVTLCDRQLALRPGDSPARFERVAECARQLHELSVGRQASRGCEADATDELLYALLTAADELLQARDEAERLRGELLSTRKKAFETERERDIARRENAVLRAKLGEDVDIAEFSVSAPESAAEPQPDDATADAEAETADSAEDVNAAETENTPAERGYRARHAVRGSRSARLKGGQR